MRFFIMSTTNTIKYCEELIVSTSSYDDCLQRNVIGRAYYHAFYEIRYHLEKRLKWAITNRNCGVHEQIYSRFSGYPKTTLSMDEEKKAAELRNRITNLKKLRTSADYKLNLSISKEMAEYTILESKEISKEIENFLKQP